MRNIYERYLPAILCLIPQGIKRGMSQLLQKRTRIKYYPPVYDAVSDETLHRRTVSNKSRRALLSYLTSPFRPLPKGIRNENGGELRAENIVKVLEELRYSVDVVQFNDTKFVPSRHYDLFIGHAGYNFENIARKLSVDTVKIYFSTGMYWQEHNRLEKERFTALGERRGIRLEPDRLITHSEEYANSMSDGIIISGSDTTKASYAKFPLVIALNNAARRYDGYEKIKKDFARGRDKFLFFAGSGNVHKGLDLLLEAFTKITSHLYICQHISSDFYKAFRRELTSYPNIHFIGNISLRSKCFCALIDKCNYIIHPSCAEGQSDAVVQCMHRGLIPVVSRQTGVNVSDFGVFLESCSPQEVAEVVQRLSQYPHEHCRDMSEKTHQAAITKFCEPAVRQSIKAAIEHIVSCKAKKVVIA